MIAFHGSNSNFKSLRISKSLVKRTSTLENEGLGIYFTTDLDTAKSYGKYVYVLEINDNYVIDFRDIRNCQRYICSVVNDVKSVFGIDISNYIDVASLCRFMTYGGLSLYNICNEVCLLLDSNGDWYSDYSSAKIDKVFRYLRKYDKSHLYAYMFTYSIKNTGVLKTVDESVVKIVGKWRY